ncbi:hypothetical protein BCT76_08115 [Vibrio tasmaniensis]|uniref:hypothetical protein n=1 Tax=Vibrio tasmaniensis TaxID=212663 RepID=UPI000C860B57|nr:hypothetical protein [Vibrio tasmaniensis]PML49355.1 hypothetical protein BCT76_08115 [Vibrio tasmaniensis]
MGIGSNYYVEVAQQEHEEALRQEMARDAAVDIVNGNSRSSSIEAAEKRIAAQQEAFSTGAYTESEDGVVYFNDSSIESPAIPRGKEAQVKAIEEELLEQFD